MWSLFGFRSLSQLSIINFRRMSATNILKFSPLPTPCEIRGTAAANRSVKQDKGTAG